MKNIFLIPTNGLDRNRGVLFADSLENGKLVKNFYDRNIEWKDCAYYHIYITDASEIKEGDWVLYGFNLETVYEGAKDWKFTESDIIKCISLSDKGALLHKKGNTDKELCKKIILTTDPDLIEDGVQSIDNDFFDWFVENTTCEFVDVIKEMYVPQSNGKISDGRISHEISLNPSDNTLPFYKIIIPQEEPKEDLVFPEGYYDFKFIKGEKIEDAAKRFWKESTANPIEMAIFGAKWQSEQDKNDFSEEEVFELTLNALDLGMTIRQDQLKGYSEKSGKELHKEWFEKIKNK